MAELLTPDEITAALSGLSGWTRDGDTITRTADLPDFPTAIQAVVRIAELAESVQHHPDIDIRYRTLTFRLSTHSDGGLTAKDPALAQQIDGVIDQLGPA